MWSPSADRDCGRGAFFRQDNAYSASMLRAAWYVLFDLEFCLKRFFPAPGPDQIPEMFAKLHSNSTLRSGDAYVAHTRAGDGHVCVVLFDTSSSPSDSVRMQCLARSHFIVATVSREKRSSLRLGKLLYEKMTQCPDVPLFISSTHRDKSTRCAV